MEQTTKFKDLWLCQNEFSNPDTIGILHTAHPRCVVFFPADAENQEQFNENATFLSLEQTEPAPEKCRAILELMYDFMVHISEQKQAPLNLPPQWGVE